MNEPQRVQRRRTAGWRMPAGAVYVGRGSDWGNPFTGPSCVDAYRRWLTSHGSVVIEVSPGGVQFAQGAEKLLHWDRPRKLRERLGELRGHDLVCWCPPSAECHADVLLELANR